MNFRTYVNYSLPVGNLDFYEGQYPDIDHLIKALQYNTGVGTKEERLNLIEAFQAQRILTPGQIIIFPDTHPIFEEFDMRYPKEFWTHDLVYIHPTHFDIDYDSLTYHAINIADMVELTDISEKIQDPPFINIEGATAKDFRMFLVELERVFSKLKR